MFFSILFKDDFGNVNTCLIFLSTLLFIPHPELRSRFVKFHEDMLRTMCIFQRRVVQQLRSLHRHGRAHITLEKWAEHQEPMLRLIERDSSYDLFKRHFSQRVGAVFKWIRSCEKRAAER